MSGIIVTLTESKSSVSVCVIQSLVRDDATVASVAVCICVSAFMIHYRITFAQIIECTLLCNSYYIPVLIPVIVIRC